MYKRITHDIIEEHFANPGFSLAPASEIIYDDQTVLRNQIRKVFGEYLWRVRNNLISAADADNASAKSIIEQQLTADVMRIYNIIRVYYGDELAASFQIQLLGLARSIADFATALNAGKDTTPFVHSITAYVDAIAAVLSIESPDYLPASTIKDRWTTATNAWINQAIARNNKDWTTDIAEMDIARRALLAPYTGPLNVPIGFSDLLTNAIVYRYPEKFTK